MRSNEKIGLRRVVRHDRVTTLAAFSTLMAACSSLLGVEDLREGRRPGDAEGGNSGASSGKSGAGTDEGSAGSASGSGGSSGEAGSGDIGGSSASGGSAGVGADGGTSGTTDTGNGGENMGGDTGTAGTMGEAGTGDGGTGSTTPVDMTVRGTVVDFYRHPVPGITVEVNGTEVLTDSQGAFVVEDAPATYDVSFVVEWSSLRQETYGWVFQGLTRRDPTLQVYRALNEYGMDTNVQAEGGAPTDTQNLTLAVGSQHGTWQQSGLPRDSVSYYWTGPTATAATAHGLLWTYDAATQVPTEYISYDTFPVALGESAATQTFTVNVTPSGLAQGNISGAITNPSPSAPINYGFLRFTSGATIQLFDDDPGPATFSYLVPSIPNASITFAASDEDWNTGEFALVHRDGIAPGTSNIALEIPATASLTGPAGGAGTMVNDTTPFRYQNRQPGVGAVVVVFEDRETYRGMFVVTSSTNFTLPRVLQGGFGLRPGILHAWQVHTHGTFESVDAMASPNGFADAFSVEWFAPPYEPVGPNTASGTFTMSASREFTYQP